MHCPDCRHPDTRVVDTRVRDNSVRRRRECAECSVRFTTLERVYNTRLMVEKRSGKLEAFSAEKLTKSIQIACAKRYLPVGAIDEIVEEIQQRVVNEGRDRIESGVIGEMVLNQLRSLDDVAYLRFASVYKDFEDPERFATEVDRLGRADSEVSDLQGALLPSPATPPIRHLPRRNQSSAIDTS